MQYIIGDIRYFGNQIGREKFLTISQKPYICKPKWNNDEGPVCCKKIKFVK